MILTFVIDLIQVDDDVGSINTASHSRNVIHKTMTLNSIDTDLFLPDMSEPSQLFSDDQRKLLYRHIPPRIQGHTWSLAFSTHTHGFSLGSLYRACARLDCPVLLVVQDTEHAVFGACISEPPQPSDKFLGTGESWLFTFYPSFKVDHLTLQRTAALRLFIRCSIAVFNANNASLSTLSTTVHCVQVYQWTGENSYIMRASPDTLVIGSSEGGFGLWLDGGFSQGRSQHTATFDNRPLPGREDFVINNLECWSFQ